MLNVELPGDMSSALCDGVVLCHLANHVRPYSVQRVHVPSPTMVGTCMKCAVMTVTRKIVSKYENNNSNNNIADSVYGAVIMT